MKKRKRLKQINRELARARILAECQLQAVRRIEVIAETWLALLTQPRPPVGINAVPGEPVGRPPSEVSPVAKCKCSIVKKSAAGGKKAAAGSKADGSTFVFIDNEDSTVTVQGVDAAGAAVDISATATLSVSSDNPSVVTVDSPIGMTFLMHGIGVGSANIAVVATANDGSYGPFSFSLPVTCAAGGPTGITVTPGTPVVR